jgi:allantoicase
LNQRLSKKPNPLATSKYLINPERAARRASQEREHGPYVQGFETGHPDKETNGKCVIQYHEYSDAGAEVNKQTKENRQPDKKFTP